MKFSRLGRFPATLLVCLVGCCIPDRPQYDGTALSGKVFPWMRYEAEDAGSNVGISSTYRKAGMFASEASGRSYRQLAASTDWIDFRVEAQANALVVRYALPDAPEGGGTSASLRIARNHKDEVDLPISSGTAWVYGDYPWSHDPARGHPRHFFDEQRIRISPVDAGDVLRVRLAPGAKSTFCAIDFIELELVDPPLAAPENSVSLLDYDAVPDDDLPDDAGLRTALSVAREAGRPLWIPPGTFHFREGPFDLGGVTLRGAGVWYSVLTGPGARFRGTGVPVDLADFAVFGSVDRRDDSRDDNAFTGNFGDGSRFRNLWIEHVKCGIWTRHGTVNLRIERCRIRNTMADGINLCDGTSFSIVERCHIRNTGDDGLATWSPRAAWASSRPCENNAFLNNLIECPWLANGIGVYGGRDHRISGNVVIDTVYSGAGLLISSGHDAVPFTGALLIQSNRFIRTGGDSYIGEPVGALWVYAADSDIDAAIRVEDLTIVQPDHAGISVHGPYRISDLISIRDPGGPGIRITSNATVSVRMHDLTVRPPGTTRVLDESRK